MGIRRELVHKQREEHAEAEVDKKKLILTPLTPLYAHVCSPMLMRFSHAHAVLPCERDGRRKRQVPQSRDDDSDNIAWFKKGKPTNTSLNTVRIGEQAKEERAEAEAEAD